MGGRKSGVGMDNHGGVGGGRRRSDPNLVDETQGVRGAVGEDPSP